MPKKKEEEEGIKVLSVNRKARFNFAITESFECGIELRGTEVKSMKEGRFSYADAFATVDGEQLWLVDFHISPYSHGNINNHDPLRRRRLLVHKKEIHRLGRVVHEKGLTLVPMRFYLKRGLVKCELAIAKGKKLFDKREDIKRRDVRREIERDFKDR
jgi:SsrA-binding protein